jgi:transcriptional regulator with XRE-family HTH domain
MRKENLPQFGRKLRELRKKRNLTLNQLAKELEFETHSYLSALESGKKQPSLGLVIKIAKLFKVTTDYLLLDE